MKTLIASFVAIVSTGSVLANPELTSAQRQKLMDVLLAGLNERGSWTSVHAAEALITLGQNEPVYAAFAPQAETSEPPFRIGVWRILARCSSTQEQRDVYVERIRKVMLDPEAPDRAHAFEALAKIKAPFVNESDRSATLEMADSSSSTAPFAAWRLAEFDDAHAMHRLVELVDSPDPVCGTRAAAALAVLRPGDDQTRTALEAALKSDSPDSPERPYIIGALGGQRLRTLAQTAPDPAVRATAITQLARTGTQEDVEMLWKLSEDTNIDVRIASAFALLRIESAQQP